MIQAKGGMYITYKDKDDNLCQGKTKNSDKLVGAKICVYKDNGEKILLFLNKIKIEGYYD